MNSGICVLCNTFTEGRSLVTVKRGLSTIINACKRRGDIDLSKQLEGLTSVEVHEKCRKDYTRENSITADVKSSQSSSVNPTSYSPVKKKLRTSDELFSYKTHCLICGMVCSEEFEKKLSQERRDMIHNVETFELKNTLLSQCLKLNDEAAKTIARRVTGVLCLVAHEARYHEKCLSKFLLKNPQSSSRVGRPEDIRRSEAFERVLQYLKNNDDCQFTMTELLNVMGEDAYSAKYLKSKLEAEFGRDILFSSLQGVGSVLTIRNTGEKILLQNWYNERKSDENEERIRITKTAAEIVREDIRAQVYEVNNYPSPSTLHSSAVNQVPETLLCFLKEVIMKGKKTNSESLDKKCITIAHTIIAATRPRSFISSIMTG